MSTTIRLTVLTGPHKGQRYCFRGPTNLTVGRAADCTIRLCGDQRDLAISRHHCRLDVNSCVRVQDMGSLNGTYRNGHKLAPAEMPEGTESLMRKLSVAAEVENGDMITVGESTFQIDMVDCSQDEAMAESAGEADCPVVC